MNGFRAKRTAQEVLDHFGFYVIACEEAYQAKIGDIVNGSDVDSVTLPGDARLVIIGQASLEDWLSQAAFKGNQRPWTCSGERYYRVVTE